MADERTEDEASSEGAEHPIVHEAVTRSAGIVERIPWWLVPLLLLGIPAVLGVGSVVAHHEVYDEFVWQYYWGPIVADGNGQTYMCSEGEVVRSVDSATCTDPDGVAAKTGYNIVNTASWALLLGLCIIGIAQILQHFRAPMDNKLILGATAWVIAGSVWHVMQDVDLFAQPLEYFFITPPIYLLFGAFGILSFLLGQYLKKSEENAGMDLAFQKLWLILSAVILFSVILWDRNWEQINVYTNPLIWTVLLAATFFFLRYRFEKLGRIDPAEMTLVMAMPALALSLVYVAVFLGGQAEGWGGTAPEDWYRYTWAITPAVAAGVAGIAYLFGRSLLERKPMVGMAFTNPINLLIIFSQTLDGLSTAIGLDFIARYEEKHVLSGAIIEGFQKFATTIGWEWGAAHPTLLAFVPLKIGVAVLVVYAMDVYSEDDARKYPTLIGLIKFAIIMVGIGPGTRNMTRMSLGE